MYDYTNIICKHFGQTIDPKHNGAPVLQSYLDGVSVDCSICILSLSPNWVVGPNRVDDKHKNDRYNMYITVLYIVLLHIYITPGGMIYRDAMQLYYIYITNMVD